VSSPGVLVIDDEPLVRRILQDLLEGAGYRVAGTGSTTEAMRELMAGDYGVVILDLGLGAFSGTRLFDMMARKLEGSLPEVVLLSGQEAPELRRQAEALGVQAWLEKGCPDEKLLEAVRGALGRYRKRCAPPPRPPPPPPAP